MENLFTKNRLIEGIRSYYIYNKNLYANQSTGSFIEALYSKNPANKVLKSLSKLLSKGVSNNINSSEFIFELTNEVNLLDISFNTSNKTFEYKYIELKTITDKIAYVIKQLKENKVTNSDILKILEYTYFDNISDCISEARQGYNYKYHGLQYAIENLQDKFTNSIYRTTNNNSLAVECCKTLAPKSFYRTAKFGKLMNKIFKDIPNTDIEELTDLLNTELAILTVDDSKETILEVKGDAIAYYYNEDNYSHENAKDNLATMVANNISTGGGELFNSCVRNQYNHTFFSIYTKNDNASMLIHIDTQGKINGRCILWYDLDTKKKYFDRLYATNNSIKIKMYGWLDANNYYNISKSNRNYNAKKDLSHDKIKLRLKNVLFKSYPYMDTFSYLDITTNTVSNNDIPDGICLRLQTSSMNQNGKPSSIRFIKENFSTLTDFKQDKTFILKTLEYLENNWSKNPDYYKGLKRILMYGESLPITKKSNIGGIRSTLTVGMLEELMMDEEEDYYDRRSENTSNIDLFKYLFKLVYIKPTNVKGLITDKNKITEDTYFLNNKIVSKHKLIKYIDEKGDTKYSESTKDLIKVLTTSNTSYIYVNKAFIEKNIDLIVYSDIYNSYVLKKYHVSLNGKILLGTDFSKAKEIFNAEETNPLYYIKKNLYKEIEFKDLINAKVLAWNDVKKLKDRKNKHITITLKDIVSVEGTKYLFYQNTFIQILSNNEKK